MVPRNPKPLPFGEEGRRFQPNMVADPATRQRSFGKLMSFTRERAVAGHFKQTHDDTVRVRGDREWSPMVVIDHPDLPNSNDQLSSHETHPTVEVKGSRVKDILHRVFDNDAVKAASKSVSLHRNYTSPDLSALDKQALLSDNMELRPRDHAHNKLPANQAAQFRKVSAPHALHRPESVGTSALPSVNTRDTSLPSTSSHMRFAVSNEVIPPVKPPTPQSTSSGTPSHADPTGSHNKAAPGTLDRALHLGQKFRDAIVPTSATPPRPANERAQTNDGTSPSRPSMASPQSSPAADLNRPLPPLPVEKKETAKWKNPLTRRKEVPAHLEFAEDLGKFDFGSYVETPTRISSYTDVPGAISASEFIKGTLKVLAEREAARQPTLQDELEAAIGDQKEETSKKVSVEDLTASYGSDSSWSEKLVTPPMTGSPNSRYNLHDFDQNTTSDLELAKTLQDFFNDEAFYDGLEKLQIKHDEHLARVTEEDDGIIHHVSLKRSARVTKADTPLGHVKSIKTQIESPSHLKTSSSAPLESKPVIQPLKIARTGDPAWHSQCRYHRPGEGGSSNGDGIRDTIPTCSTQAARTFIPSGRGFEFVRQPARSLDIPAKPVEQVNNSQPDIENLRHELRLMRTGDRVRSVVEQIETRQSFPHICKACGCSEGNRGSLTNESAPIAPITAIGKVFEREPLIRSSDLSREAKLMMAEARQHRLHRAV